MVREKLVSDKIEGMDRRTISAEQRWGWTLFSVLVIAVLAEPAYIAETQDSLHLVFSISKYIAAAFVLLLYFIRRPKLNGFILGCVIFEGLLLLSTIGNSANLRDWFSDSAYVIVFALFLQVIIETDPKLLLTSLSMALGTYTNINTLTKLIYPGGLYRHPTLGYANCWFLGYDNAGCVIIMIAITISFFRILLYRGKGMVWDWIVIIGGIWYTFSLNVATTVIAMISFFLFMIFTKFERIRVQIGNARLVIAGMLGLFLFIQFFFTQENGLFSFLFLMLQKNSNFSGRAPLWQKAWSELRGANIIYGFGLHSTREYVAHFGKFWNVHLHCYYLQVIYEGGLAAFGAFCGWLFHAAGRFDQTEHRYCTMTLLAGLLAILLMWQMEASSYLVRYFIIVLFLIYNAKEFESLGQKYQFSRWRLVFHAHRQCIGQKKIGGNIA